MNSTAHTDTEQCLQKLEERFQFLFEPELITDICRHGKIKRYREGSLIMDVGETLTHMPLVLSGSIKIMKEDKDGNELLLYYLELGDTCAVTLSCCTKPSKSSIKAITESDSEIVFVPVAKMEDWMVKYKTWREFVLESYNQRLNEMLDAIDNLAFNNMEERIYKYLRDKAMVNREPKLQVTHAEIATDLHSSRVVISRIMKKLENEGKIVQYRNYVEITAFMKKQP
jgi:CRP/FNR family transcriptional regulator